MIESVAETVRAADAMLITAGAGMGVDSGLPDFRGDQGFWKAYPPFERLGVSFVDMANPAWFARDPELNVRPVKLFRGLEAASPLRAERLRGVDLVFIRELTGGIYFGEPKGKETKNGLRTGFDTMVYDESEIRRIVELAFEVARKRGGHVTSIDKANVLATMQVWREVATEVGKENSDVKLDHQLVDSAAMRLVTDPSSFDVIVSGNMFGDILSDEGAVLTGSLGLLPSASLGEGTLGVYEPIHGSAPDIAGKGIANPLGTILSAAMLLRHSLHLDEDAKTIEDAVQKVLDSGLRTADLSGGQRSLGTTEMTDAVVAAIEGA